MKNHKLGYTVSVLVVGALVVGYTHILRAQYGGANTTPSDTNASTPAPSNTPTADPNAPATSDMGATSMPATGGMSDKELSEQIKSALNEDPALSSVASHLKVHDGRVILKGEVASEDAKNKAASIAGEKAGVGKVEDKIKIKS